MPMSSNKRNSNPQVTIQDLYPELTPAEQSEAAYYLGRYFEVVRGIFERVQNLTDQNEPLTMEMHESNL